MQRQGFKRFCAHAKVLKRLIQASRSEQETPEPTFWVVFPALSGAISRDSFFSAQPRMGTSETVILALRRNKT
jgi:hypothetical protein